MGRRADNGGTTGGVLAGGSWAAAAFGETADTLPGLTIRLDGVECVECFPSAAAAAAATPVGAFLVARVCWLREEDLAEWFCY